jgi:hypothetical protein
MAQSPPKGPTAKYHHLGNGILTYQWGGEMHKNSDYTNVLQIFQVQGAPMPTVGLPACLLS